MGLPILERERRGERGRGDITLDIHSSDTNLIPRLSCAVPEHQDKVNDVIVVHYDEHRLECRVGDHVKPPNVLRWYQEDQGHNIHRRMASIVLPILPGPLTSTRLLVGSDPARRNGISLDVHERHEHIPWALNAESPS